MPSNQNPEKTSPRCRLLVDLPGMTKESVNIEHCKGHPEQFRRALSRISYRLAGGGGLRE
jgi:hypothetical protein